MAGEYGEGMVLTAAYREFLSAIATSAGALTGLLFVAISAAPRRGSDDSSAVIQQVRAAAALVAFFNALAVSIFGLVPGGSVRYPAVALGIGGMLFTAAGIRSVLSARSTTNQRLGQLWLVVLLLLIFGTELVAGIILLADSGRSTPVELINYALATSLLVGVARAWELVGARDTGIVAFVVTDKPVSVLALHQAARERLPDTMLPNRIELVEVLPLTSSSKVDERLLLSGVGLLPVRSATTPGGDARAG